MRKFVNNPRSFVQDMLKGIALANPDSLDYIPEYNILIRTNRSEDKVSIVQGSGAGHEPAHAMFVGRGMLDAACPGDVFQAPPMDFLYESVKLLGSEKGTLFLVNNYTGDRLAAEMATELAVADGFNVNTLVINDDIAVSNSTWTVGRRGTAGNFFVIKALGAASENGASLDELIRLGEKVNSVTRSMGVALGSCILPSKGKPLFEIAENEMEVGIGIHGEPGRLRTKTESADTIIETLLNAIVSDLPYNSGDRVALMINGLGGTPLSELYILYGIAHEQLSKLGITVARNYVGEYCTSLEMAGASITLVRLDDEIENLLAAPAEMALRTF